LKNAEYYVVAFEQDEKSVDYKEVSLEGKENIAFVIGPEVTGMTQEVLNECATENNVSNT
jgi:tRNA G18 (ribose-2'-O)-methylase SpoU